MERTDGCHIQHARNGRENRPPELSHYSVDGYCAETRTVYEFLGCYHHGCKCQPFRDVKTLTSGETLAERYKQTLARIEQLERSGCVKVQWECEFEGADDLLTHPVVRHEPMNTQEGLYGVEPKQCVFTIKSERMWSLYSPAMSLYPYIRKYFKFPIGQTIIHVGDACADRSLSKDRRPDEMKDRAAQGPLSPGPTVQIRQKTVILPVPNVSKNITLRANVDISAMPRDIWKARAT